MDSPSAADGAAPAEATLRGCGLARDGFIWITPVERELQDALAALPKLERDFRQAQSRMAGVLAQNAAVRRQLLKVKQEIDELERLLQGGLSAAKRARVVQERSRRVDWYSKFLPQAYDAAARNDIPALRGAVVDFANTRDAVALTMLRVREQFRRLERSYVPLREDPEVKRALKSLGLRHKLGPARNYRTQLRRLDRLEETVFTDQVPVYLTNKHFRLTAIVNERTPVTFTYRPEREFSLLSATALQSAGLKPAADSPARTVEIDVDRRITAREITLPRLRLGRHVLKNIKVLALKPEDEDLGSSLGSDALEGYRVEFSPQDLHFSLEPEPRR